MTPELEILDPRFRRYLLHNALLERIADGCRWTEGPVWFGDAGCLLFSDIPNDRILRWSETEGVSVHRRPSRFANGNTRDRAGRLVSCLHGARAVVRTEHDGSETVLADRIDGRRLNSPNDVVVASDGGIWFTDPHYGIALDYEGGRAEQEQPCRVWRIDPHSATTTLVSDEYDCPNGLCFSPDESRLYIAETGRMHDTAIRREIRVHEVHDLAAGRIGAAQPYYRPAGGTADGFRADEDGNIWTSAGKGVDCVDPAGQPLGRLNLPEIVANVAFGGRRRSRLFVCSSTTVHALYLDRRGAT